MSYEKQTWATGDTITETKLNHMEDGIAGGGVLVVNGIEVGGTLTLDKTWQEIYDAGAAVMLLPQDNTTGCAWLDGVGAEDGEYFCTFYNSSASKPFVLLTDSADGYPVVTAD